MALEKSVNFALLAGRLSLWRMTAFGSERPAPKSSQMAGLRLESSRVRLGAAG